MPSLRTDSIDAVVFGASAGGIEALSMVLPSIVATTRVAVFIVLHLPKDQPSLLPSIFSQRCAVAVREAAHDESAEPGTVYFAPPDYHLMVDDGPRLALSCDELVNYARPSIDVLFEAAADVYGERLLAVLLSGGNQDGAAGVEYVQQQGGLVIVQQPDTALVPQMPLSALARMTPDAVMTLSEIAEVMQALPIIKK